MNLKEFEKHLILNGTDLKGWGDKALAGQAEAYIKKTKSAKELYNKYKELDKKLSSLSVVKAPKDLDSKIMARLENEEFAKSTSIFDNIFIVLNPRVFVPVLSLLIVVSLSISVLEQPQYTEEQVYSYAEEVMFEIQAEDEIKAIDEEAEYYQDILKLI